ncbi:MAG TPA: hypothetical protein VF126_01345, partial [Acidobacteriaceae bacterium]
VGDAAVKFAGSGTGIGGNLAGADGCEGALCADGASGGFAWLNAGTAVVEATQSNPASTLLRT